MKLASHKIFLAVASVATLVVVTGCPKNPDRPNPGQTVLGPGTGGPNVAPPPMISDTSFRGTDLTPRDTGGFDPMGQNRSALQAQTVYFDFDKSDIKPAEREKLKVAKEYLEKNPTHRLLLEGHCDWRGTAEYNLSLGDRRANAVKKYLQTAGIKPDRLENLSKGSLEANKNADEATMAKDRRVDLVVIDPSKAAANPL